jgi:hypothetical protein
MKFSVHKKDESLRTVSEGLFMKDTSPQSLKDYL